jgi:hypothetical protein
MPEEPFDEDPLEDYDVGVIFQSGLSYQASGGLLAGEPGGQPCPLRLI